MSLEPYKRPTDFVFAHAQEAVKQYIVYDGSNRMVTTYVATVAAVTGSPCMRTDYAYDGSSTRVTKMRESLDVWDASYDI